ncbi:hypothetical protein [Myroides odoratus]|uniref:hypothetical protein n=1 Tax=Myroides odoratus TaxID=256 RepID=UPI000765C926|nr:hypothetical protein [Myroides odoratus]
MDLFEVKKERFIESINYLKFKSYIKNNKDLSDLGIISESSLSRALKGDPKYLTDNLINKFCNQFTFFNISWLNGEDLPMLKNPINERSNLLSVIESEDVLEDNDVEVLTNSNGNKFFIYPSGLIKIEVPKVPFDAHASYLECYFDDVKTLDDWDKITFTVDHIGRGSYLGFQSQGESMNGGLIDDTPSGAEILGREIGNHLWKDGFRKTKYGLILITESGIWHKDITDYNIEKGMLTLSSRNKKHNPFDYPINSVKQIFNVIKRNF